MGHRSEAPGCLSTAGGSQDNPSGTPSPPPPPQRLCTAGLSPGPPCPSSSLAPHLTHSGLLRCHLLGSSGQPALAGGGGGPAQSGRGLGSARSPRGLGGRAEGGPQPEAAGPGMELGWVWAPGQGLHGAQSPHPSTLTPYVSGGPQAGVGGRCAHLDACQTWQAAHSGQGCPPPRPGTPQPAAPAPSAPRRRVGEFIFPRRAEGGVCTGTHGCPRARRQPLCSPRVLSWEGAPTARALSLLVTHRPLGLPSWAQVPRHPV